MLKNLSNELILVAKPPFKRFSVYSSCKGSRHWHQAQFVSIVSQVLEKYQVLQRVIALRSRLSLPGQLNHRSCMETLQWRLPRFGVKMSNKEGHSKALAYSSCAIACLAALSQGVLLTWLNPVLPQVHLQTSIYMIFELLTIQHSKPCMPGGRRLRKIILQLAASL